MRRLFLCAVVVVMTAGCATTRNYVDTDGPRYAGIGTGHRAPAVQPDSLRVVTFNIELAQEVDIALDLLREEASLRAPDVLLLQEMDEPSVRRIADSLGLQYVYYPAAFSLRTDRDFGNAVLTRWSIIADEKLILPHDAVFARSQRIATAATVQMGRRTVRVYSVHLATLVQVLPGARREQLQTVLDDAAPYPHVVIGGDLNTQGLGRMAQEQGYLTPTEEGPPTTPLGRWDHIFLKGFSPRAMDASGTLVDTRGASDHRPVWTVAVFPTG